MKKIIVCIIVGISSFEKFYDFYPNNFKFCAIKKNPQIQLHSYHHGSQHVTLKFIFHKLKVNFLKSFYCSQHGILLLVFLSAMIQIKSNFLYHQTKAFQHYHVKQINFRLSIRLNNHLFVISALWLSTCTSKQSVFDFS